MQQTPRTPAHTPRSIRAVAKALARGPETTAVDLYTLAQILEDDVVFGLVPNSKGQPIEKKYSRLSLMDDVIFMRAQANAQGIRFNARTMPLRDVRAYPMSIIQDELFQLFLKKMSDQTTPPPLLRNITKKTPKRGTPTRLFLSARKTTPMKRARR